VDGRFPSYGEWMHPPLSDVPDSMACDPSVAEIVPLDVRWDRFGVMAGFVRPIPVKDVLRPLARGGFCGGRGPPCDCCSGSTKGRRLGGCGIE
jgi:hypothetical protein